LLAAQLLPTTSSPTIDRMGSEPLIVEQEVPGVLRLRGPLTLENLPSFQNAVRREVTPTIFLDLTEVPYVDSAGLGSLVSAYISRHKSGQRVVLSGVNDRVLNLFEITRVEPLFLIFPTLGDAIGALLNSGSA
jgi:anti-sigma B factor antagonist